MTANAQKPVEDVCEGIREGSTEIISRYFDNNISLSINGTVATYSRPQAEMVLRDFFRKNDPKQLNVEHSGGGETSKFCIATLITSSGNFKTYLSFKQGEHGYIIQEIRFEK